VTEAFTPLLEKSKNGRPIYVTSDLGPVTERSDPSSKYYKLGNTPYRMSKAALDMLMMCHHVELGTRRGYSLILNIPVACWSLPYANTSHLSMGVSH
jgi:NAD(P)-dependent dehydrogenase (short-subunit alcohol dehydrogenase family)